jgi:L-ribulose-5-phosphate 3-epimerase
MAKSSNWSIGVCGWSMQTDVAGVADTMRQLGISHVHLDVGPAIGTSGQEYLKAVQAQDWTISATMIGFPQEDYSTLEAIQKTGGIVPDECWDTNRERFFAAVDITRQLGVKYISTHLGFIDESDAAYAQKIKERTQCLADRAAQAGLTFLLETGQESAADLKAFLQELDHPNIGVNFDPANIILYDKGDPIESVRTLGPWIKHIHIKDATRTETPGTWGAEVPWGEGQVGAGAFLDALTEIGFAGTIAIEREAGDSRVGDIKLAVERLTS